MLPKYPKHGRVKHKRLKSPIHDAYIRQQPCANPQCGKWGVEPHHLIGTYLPKLPFRGGVRRGDNWAIPLCRGCHSTLHLNGDEKAVFEMWGLNGLQLSIDLWAKTEDWI